MFFMKSISEVVELQQILFSHYVEWFVNTEKYEEFDWRT